jgi:predicted enzyme related to lactoylglutathione lyase
MEQRSVYWRRAAGCGLILALAWFALTPVEAAKKKKNFTIAPGTFLGANLVTEDAAGAVAFYTELFGWEAEKTDRGYAIQHKGQLIASVSQIDDSMANVTESFWMVALAVNNLKLSVAAAAQNGAVVFRPISKMREGNGKYAVIGDAEKAPISLLEIRGTDVGGTTGPGSWAWAELWSDDIDKAAQFYANVIGLGHEEYDRGGAPYHVFTSQGEPRAGIIKIPAEFEDVKPGWAPYVAVADLSASTKKVEDLGGSVIFRTEHPAEGAVALILDPSGGALFLYQIGSHEEASK